MSDRENKNPSVEELLALLNTLIKENEFLKFENDTLIKQNKLHIAVFEKQQRRIENINRFNELLNKINLLPESNIENNTSKNESKLPGDEGEQSNNEMNTSSNESIASHNESNTSNNEMNNSNNESNTSSNESNTSNNERITSSNESNTSSNESIASYNESKTSNNESNTSSNESNTSNNESNTSNNESNTSNNESNSRNNESIIQNIEKNIRINIDKIPLNKENNSEEEVNRAIKEKLGKKFGKKYFDKTLSRYADEIFYINKNEKIRVEEIQSYTNISFPAIMRDILFLKKHKWIEKVGPHKGGHYALTKIGKELCEKELK
jgi:hypothetical protein